MQEARPYKHLTEESFLKFFEELHDPKPRTLVVHCGQGFKEMLDRKIQEEVLMQMLPILVNSNLISLKECINLEAMIKSDDKENFYIAKSIIDNIQNHGNIISSK